VSSISLMSWTNSLANMKSVEMRFRLALRWVWIPAERHFCGRAGEAGFSLN
jgi:hypothetical protein